MMRTRVSAKGQVVIPREIRTRLGLKEGTEIEIEPHRNGVLLRKANPGSWRRWEGRLHGLGLVEALERDHRWEIARDRKRIGDIRKRVRGAG